MDKVIILELTKKCENFLKKIKDPLYEKVLISRAFSKMIKEESLITDTINQKVNSKEINDFYNIICKEYMDSLFRINELSGTLVYIDVVLSNKSFFIFIKEIKND